MDNLLNKYNEVKSIVNDLIENDYKNFVKALISIEKNINDETKLDKVYEEFMNNDDMSLINNDFENILYDISIEEKYIKTRLDNIELIDTKKADEILNSDVNGLKYEPLGSFYYKNNDMYVAIDNSSGDAFVEEFNNFDDCIDWLNNKFEMSDYIEKKGVKTSIQEKFTNAKTEAEKRNKNNQTDISKTTEHEI